MIRATGWTGWKAACLLFAAGTLAGGIPVLGAQTSLQSSSQASSQAGALDSRFFTPQPKKAPWLLDWGVEATAAAVSEGQGLPDNLVVGGSGQAWARLSLPGLWQFYGRAKDNILIPLVPWPAAGFQYLNFWEINAAYLQYVQGEGGVTLGIGRKFFLLGSGLILAGNGDGLELQLANPWFNAKAFGYYTGFQGKDFSTYAMHDWDRENGPRRYFGGYSFGVSVFGQDLALLGMYQSDFRMGPKDLYTSWYSGFQAKGLVLGGEYLAEWYQEKGFSPSGAGRDTIDAYAGIARYTRAFRSAAAPRLTVQYALASGDGDRTIGKGAPGNTKGQDLAFQAFGQVRSGSVFRPSFSNIHIAHLGFVFNPLGGAPRRFKGTSIGLGYFYYAKHDAAGVVNTEDAKAANRDLGHGLDLNVQFSLFNDSSLFVNGGVFFPGAAFSGERTLRYSLSGGLSFSL